MDFRTLSVLCLSSFSAFLMQPSASFAQESRRALPTRQSSLTSTGWTLFGQFGAGLGTVKSSEYYEAPTGEQILLGASLNYEVEKWILETGASWFYSRVAGHETQNRSIRIKTRSGLLTLNPRYRISDRWQLGPVLETAFGANTAYGPKTEGEVASYFVGARAVYELSQRALPVRLWAQASTDLSISNRQVYLTWVGVQLGLPIGRPRRSPETEDSLSLSRASPQRQDRHQLRVALDPQKIFFNTKSDELKPEVKAVLGRIGEYLKNNSLDWEALEISGHADQRGKFDYNLKLSRKRALSVQNVLVQSGADSKRLKTKAFSYLKPIDPNNNRDAWNKNRRVELVFENVVHPEELLNLVRPLMTLAPIDEPIRGKN